jgi:penicillin-binding protein 1A
MNNNTLPPPHQPNNSPSAFSIPPAFVQDLPVDLPVKLAVVQKRQQFLTQMGLLGLVVVFLFMLSVNIGFLMAKTVAQLPNVSQLHHWKPTETTRIYDRNNTLIANISGDEDRIVMPISSISPYLPRAIMAIEDNRFYHHGGVDFKGTLRAIASNIKGGDVQGGSTLTQQLVKNLYLTPERSLGRKLAEALLALRIEKVYDKTHILALYLNIVYWGNHAYGAEKAARVYFNKSCADLSIAEAALLAGLLKAPEGLSPYVYPEAAISRQKTVLAAMKAYGFITEAQYQQAFHEPLVFNRSKPVYQFPFFVDYVRQELISYLGEDMVHRGGLQVITSLDQPIQQAAEIAVKQGIAKTPKGSRVDQAALISLDVKANTIVAMVGGANYAKSQFNIATMARRAPGSTFKPFVYLTGFRLGWLTPDTIISDRPLVYGTGSRAWRPKNYDGIFLGPIKIRHALAKSRNTTTIQVGQRAGVKAVLETARLAGITSPVTENFSSLLGSSGVSPLEIATAYATFAREGIYKKPTVILRLQNNQGQVLPLPDAKTNRAFESWAAAMINSALQTVVQEGTGKPARLANRWVAGKTGTTDETRDIWFAGYTPDMVSVVWMGHSRNLPLRGVFSSNCVAVWREFSKAYYTLHPVEPKPFEAYNGMPPLADPPKVINTNSTFE